MIDVVCGWLSGSESPPSSQKAKQIFYLTKKIAQALSYKPVFISIIGVFI